MLSRSSAWKLSKQCCRAAVSEGQGRAISLAALTVLEVSPMEAVRIASACAYSHVGLRPVAATPDEPHFPILSDNTLTKELTRTLNGEGLGVLDVEIVRLTPEMDWALLGRVLEFSARFGASRLLVADNDPDPVRSRDNLSRLAAMAIPYSVQACLEFMPWTCAPDLQTAKNRVADISNCALLIDAFHLARSGGQPADLQPALPEVSYIQLCDIAGPIPAMDEILREARSDRLFPGDGEIDLTTLLNRLPDLPLSLEIPSDRLRSAGYDAATRARLAMDRTLTVLDRASAQD